MTPAPRPIRVAGAVVALQGSAALAVAVVLAVRAPHHPGSPVGGFALAGYFALLGAGVAAVGAGLLRSRRWARPPALLLQLLLLGAAWYALRPSNAPQYGVPAGLVCLVVLGLLLSPAARSWALRQWRRPPAR